jgi:hypothetical protein
MEAVHPVFFPDTDGGKFTGKSSLRSAPYDDIHRRRRGRNQACEVWKHVENDCVPAKNKKATEEITMKNAFFCSVGLLLAMRAKN